MKKPYVSKNVIRRMPRYLRILDELSANGVERISSGELGACTGLTPSQIRQDFSCFGEFGQQGYGYNVISLRDEIAHILGLDKGCSIILLGTGRIGHTLIENLNFSRFGFRLLAAFDVNTSLIGTTISGILVRHAREVEGFVRDNKVDIAILSTTREQAQRAADRVIRSGIRGIWNFTEQEIDPGDSGVTIESIHFSDSLLTLSYHLREKGGEEE